MPASRRPRRAEKVTSKLSTGKASSPRPAGDRPGRPEGEATATQAQGGKGQGGGQGQPRGPDGVRGAPDHPGVHVLARLPEVTTLLSLSRKPRARGPLKQPVLSPGQASLCSDPAAGHVQAAERGWRSLSPAGRRSGRPSWRTRDPGGQWRGGPCAEGCRPQLATVHAQATRSSHGSHRNEASFPHRPLEQGRPPQTARQVPNSQAASESRGAPNGGWPRVEQEGPGTVGRRPASDPLIDGFQGVSSSPGPGSFDGLQTAASPLKNAFV